MDRLIHRVSFSTYFEKSFSVLPERIKKLARTKDRLFRRNAFHPALSAHKLHGEFKEYWAYSVNREYRVLFSIDTDHAVVYINIGTHEIYK